MMSFSKYILSLGFIVSGLLFAAAEKFPNVEQASLVDIDGRTQLGVGICMGRFFAQSQPETYHWLRQIRFDRAAKGGLRNRYFDEDVFSGAWNKRDTKVVLALEKNAISLWNIKPWKYLFSMIGHLSQVHSVGWSFDESMIASGSEDCTLRIWQSKTGVCLNTVACVAPVRSIAWSKKERLIVAGLANGSLNIWNVDKNSSVSKLSGLGAAVHSVAWSADESLVAAGLDNGVFTIWKPACKKNKMVDTRCGASPCIVSWMPRTSVLAVACQKGTIFLWDAEAHTLLKKIMVPCTILSIDWDNSGNYLAVGSDEGIVYVLDVRNNAVSALRGHKNRITSVAWSSDGTTLLSGSCDKTFGLWPVPAMHEFDPAIETLSINQQELLVELFTRHNTYAKSHKGNHKPFILKRGWSRRTLFESLPPFLQNILIQGGYVQLKEVSLVQKALQWWGTKEWQ